MGELNEVSKGERLSADWCNDVIARLKMLENMRGTNGICVNRLAGAYSIRFNGSLVGGSAAYKDGYLVADLDPPTEVDYTEVAVDVIGEDDDITVKNYDSNLRLRNGQYVIIVQLVNEEWRILYPTANNTEWIRTTESIGPLGIGSGEVYDVLIGDPNVTRTATGFEVTVGNVRENTALAGYWLTSLRNGAYFIDNQSVFLESM